MIMSFSLASIFMAHVDLLTHNITNGLLFSLYMIILYGKKAVRVQKMKDLIENTQLLLVLISTHRVS